MIYIQALRSNDVNPNGGKQIEFGKAFFESFGWTSGESYPIKIHYKSSLIETSLKVRGSDRGGDRIGADCKEYANEDGEFPLKSFFINKMRLSKNHVGSVHFILESLDEHGEEFNLYFVPAKISSPDKREDFEEDEPLQQIFYGAPGTGKSDCIKRKESLFSEVIRTTFHPDSDYATFVGAYKPVMETNYGVVLSADELCDELKMLKNIRVSNPYYSFGAKYWYSLQKFSNDDISLLLKETGGTTRDKEEMQKGIVDGKSSSTGSEKRIAYKFVKQAFLKAYISAWKGLNEQNDVLLVIEEINRGNCAQIFGDLFQLLDRETEGENIGYSTYPIVTDEDLREVLAEDFKDIEGIPENVKSGENLLLPPNLYIWATMNTSDQSLFPIDSAFKRRWDWVYKPIKYSNESWKVVLADGSWCSWIKLQQKLNDLIYDATESEDKMLGDWFVRAENDVISEEVLVGKIIFYLWNDVAKVDAGKLFDLEVEKRGRKRKVIFSDFYEVDGTINSEVVRSWLNMIKVAIYENEDTEETESFDTNTKDVKFSKPEYAHILAPLKDHWGESSWYGGNGSAGNIVCQSLHLQVAGKNKNNSICVTLNSSGKQAEVKVWYNNSNEVEKLKKAGIDTFMQNYSEENNCIFRDFTDNTVHKGWGIIHEEFPFDKPEDGMKWIQTTMEKLKNEIDSKLA